MKAALCFAVVFASSQAVEEGDRVLMVHQFAHRLHNLPDQELPLRIAPRAPVARKRLGVAYLLPDSGTQADALDTLRNMQSDLLSFNLSHSALPEVATSAQLFRFSAALLTDTGEDSIDAETVSQLRSYAREGGRLVLCGHANALRLLNRIAETTIAEQSAELVAIKVSSQVASSRFGDEAPPVLPTPTGAVLAATASLPASALAVYSDAASTAVFEMPYGEGSATFLGYDWRSSLGAAWADVLRLALEAPPEASSPWRHLQEFHTESIPAPEAGLPAIGGDLLSVEEVVDDSLQHAPHRALQQSGATIDSPTAAPTVAVTGARLLLRHSSFVFDSV
ncbi:hypothetical protein CYMTET_37457 [Cymbomonas tetramitiformis]|uniref:Uncharacterized protein n=1 Tax=Cymbomonas tetramitiformis TaxID=36881 RepID=A0AAE0F6F0_9CHLO|nr:hypothetical protein CYMTET_37457 [Cymbomonas tetramitiformis]